MGIVTSVRGIAAELHTRGTRAPRGDPWRGKSVDFTAHWRRHDSADNPSFSGAQL
jgi:hypothetical protein